MTHPARQRKALSITVTGVVQGVGFRPFIWRLAHEHALSGEVTNTPDGVKILIEGDEKSLESFTQELPKQAPPLARILALTSEDTPPLNVSSFSIAPSQAGKKTKTLIPSDIATCNACLAEVADPQNRRHAYPFTNCTDCGPRYTIIKGLPYDRPFTSMAPFAMCQACAREYDDPSDRRFHAQPNACPVCGPKLSFVPDSARQDEAPLEIAARFLKEKKILAVKGLGGFHLAVDATSQHAVRLLRKRKIRPSKPFAIMCRDLCTAKRLAHISPQEEEALKSPGAPIVLLQKKGTSQPIAPEVAPGTDTLGIMLPYTPLHHLLLRHGPAVQVMTSGNISGEPVIIDNDDALQKLQHLAHGFLLHNREILQRNDDTVVRIMDGKTTFIRRARGFAPLPLLLKKGQPCTLACGAILKQTLCLTRDHQAFISQHIGDLQNDPTVDFFEFTLKEMKRLLDIAPDRIAHDLHPDAPTTRFAKELERKTGKPSIAVQHHHAHIAACMAEHHLDGPVIGIALDGMGLGIDSTIWGGEVLQVDKKGFRRLAHLETTPMPGGDAAAKYPWRMAIAHAVHHGVVSREEMASRIFLPADTSDTEISILSSMVKQGTNAPLTSSMGRLFDTVSALTGLCHTNTFEGEASMALEAAARTAWPAKAYPFSWSQSKPKEILLGPILNAIHSDIKNGVAAGPIAAKFHATLIALFAALCRELRDETEISNIALSGGVFCNKLLTEGLCQQLRRDGFSVYTHHQVPPGDGGISLGQAWIAGQMEEIMEETT